MQTTPGQVPAGLPVPLASNFTRRPDTLGRLDGMLVPGAAVALVPDQDAATGAWDWRGARGKTQAAAHATVYLRRAGSVDLVAWVDASGRTSLLDGLASAAARAGLDTGGGAEVAAARLVAWLRVTRQRWLVVLDACVMLATWPACGLAGRRGSRSSPLGTRRWPPGRPLAWCQLAATASGRRWPRCRPG
jgi:hypothetical protein